MHAHQGEVKKSEYFAKRRGSERVPRAVASSYFTRGLVRGTSHTGSYLGDLIPGNVLSSYISADLASLPLSSPFLTPFFALFRLARDGGGAEEG